MFGFVVIDSCDFGTAPATLGATALHLYNTHSKRGVAIPFTDIASAVVIDETDTGTLITPLRQAAIMTAGALGLSSSLATGLLAGTATAAIIPNPTKKQYDVGITLHDGRHLVIRMNQKNYRKFIQRITH